MSSVVISRDVQQTHDRIVANDSAITWAVYAYDNPNELKVQNFGSDDMTELADEFSEGKLQYAFLRLNDPNSQLPKLVLIGWCGEGAPRKGIFQQHFASVAKQLSGYHVQITARSLDDLDLATIQKKVEDSSGAKYTPSNTAALFGTSRKVPTTNSLVNQLKTQSEARFDPRKPTLSQPRLPTSSTPATKQTLPRQSPQSNYASKKEDLWNKTSDEPRPEDPVRPAVNLQQLPVKSAYVPIGRPDINALRAQAQDNDEKQATAIDNTGYNPTTVPKMSSLASRMTAFTATDKSSELGNSRPQPRANPLAARFGKPSMSTKPAVPGTQVRESKALGGLSKDFGAEGGKTPAQLWAERKARERGETIPTVERQAPVKATVYNEPQDTGSSVSAVSSQLHSARLDTIVPVIPPVMPASRPIISKPPVVSRDSDTEEPSLPAEQDRESTEAADEPVAIEMNSERHDPAQERQGSSGHSSDPVGITNPPQLNMSTRPSMHSTGATTAHGLDSDSGARETLSRDDATADFKTKLSNSLGAQHSPQTAGAKHIEHNEESVNTNIKHKAKALYDYEAQEENELGFEEGDIVVDIEMVDEGWWSGACQGRSGLFPANYVELLDSQSEENDKEAASMTHTIERQVHKEHEESTNDEGLTAVALYDYEAAEEDELSFSEGDRITAIDQIDEGWWKGVCGGQEGLFPANYVELQ